MPRGNKNLYNWSWSHDQHGRHAHIWQQAFKSLLLQNHKSDALENWHTAKGLEPYKVYIKDDPRLTLAFLQQVQLFYLAFTLKNLEKNKYKIKVQTDHFETYNKRIK